MTGCLKTLLLKAYTLIEECLSLELLELDAPLLLNECLSMFSLGTLVPPVRTYGQHTGFRPGDVPQALLRGHPLFLTGYPSSLKTDIPHVAQQS